MGYIIYNERGWRGVISHGVFVGRFYCRRERKVMEEEKHRCEVGKVEGGIYNDKSWRGVGGEGGGGGGGAGIGGGG